MKRFHHLNLRSKIIAVFLALALLPLLFQTFWNVNSTKKSLINAASQALKIAAEKSGNDLDALLTRTLRDIEINSQLRELTDLLYLPPYQRPGSPAAAGVTTIIRTLHRGAHPYGISYALLDKKGINITDTSHYGDGSDESDQSYYQEVLKTGKSYISPVIFHKSYPNKATIYFSTPVFGISGEIEGILRARFSGALLQDFIHELSGLGGMKSFGMLLNSDNLILGHSNNPSLIFKAFCPNDAVKMTKLQHRGLLPNVQLKNLCVEMHDLETILNTNSSHEIVATRLDPATDTIYQAAIAHITSAPFHIVLAQPQEAFLEPIREQINKTIFLVVITALFVVAAAIAVSHKLAKPIVRLTAMARKIAAGDLSVQMPIFSDDERGQLAKAFNSMTVQLRDLISGLQMEIDERRQGEQALRNSEDRYRRLFMDSPISLWEEDFSQIKLHLDSMRASGVSDFEQYFQDHPEVVEHCARLINVIDVNTATLQLLGAENIEQIRQGVPMAFAKEQLDIFEQELVMLAAGGDWFESEAVQQTLTGNKRKVVIQLSVAPDYKDTLAKVLVCLVDITDHKQAELEVFQLKERLLQAQKMEAIGTLAGGIAHDFNNILSAIIGYCDLALLGTNPDSKTKKYLTEMLKAGNRAKDLVQQILMFARNSTEKKEPIQVSLVVKEVLKLLRASLPTTINIQQHLLSDAKVFSDTTRIHQVLMNLCTNAGKAMKDDGGTLTVSLEELYLDREFITRNLGYGAGNHLKLTVKDTGVGMPPEDLSKIFDPFFTTRSKDEGTGLGLSVVHGIVQDCKGFITVSTEQGNGSEFTIYLPVTDIAETPIEDVSLDLPTGSERILLIDDEHVLVEMLSNLLHKLGYKVDGFTNSLEALQVFSENPDNFDLIITDMTMPHLSGDKLATQILAIRDNIPIILNTGFSDQISEEQALLIGVKQFLMKPVEIRKLAVAIRNVLKEAP